MLINTIDTLKQDISHQEDIVTALKYDQYVMPELQLQDSIQWEESILDSLYDWMADLNQELGTLCTHEYSDLIPQQWIDC